MTQREVKFRFWDKDLKKMSYRQPLAYDFTHPNIIPEQFTGFKDKNGAPIFEGDILGDWNDIDGVMTQSKMQVFWDGKVGAWALDNSYKQDKSSGDLLSEELALSAYEVVGNIHDTQS